MSRTFYFISICVLFLLANKSYAATGCSTYQGLYPNSLNRVNPATGNPLYENTNYIPFRTWDQDPKCGIRDTRITSLNKPCDVRNVRNYGELVSYDPAFNNCPIDEDIVYVLIGSICMGFLVIKKNGD